MTANQSKLSLTSLLYGRDEATATLLRAFERASIGQGRVLLVPGRSGAGKTALVQALRTPVEARNGWFLQGKFNQFHRHVPYFGFRTALAAFAEAFERRHPECREPLGLAVRESVGALGRLLVDLAPELEEVIGATADASPVGPNEARPRFAAAVRSLLLPLARPEHPLVLFIDDWQWADPASIHLLANLQIGAALRHVLVIASYREDEVGPEHPFTAGVDQLHRQAVDVDVLSVGSLDGPSLRALLRGVLAPHIDCLDELAEVVARQTGGNPFFARAFLVYLHASGALNFDPSRSTWRLRPEGLQELPSDVEGLFTRRLRRLDARCRELMSRAACLGNRFDLPTLAVVCGCTPAETQEILQAAVADDLLVADALGAQVYEFAHDRVQQAARGLIDPSALSHVRLQIGRLMLRRLNAEQVATQLFEITNHLNAGLDEISNPDELRELLSLNVSAGRQARQAAAYNSSVYFFRTATRIVDTPGLLDECLQFDGELVFVHFVERAECEFMAGSLEEAERCVERALASAEDAIEQAQALSVLVVHYTLLARYSEAIDAGRRALRGLGVHLPDDGFESARDEEIHKVRSSLGARSVMDLAAMPQMSDRRIQVAARVLITMGPPCYRSHQRLWAVIVPTVVRLTLEYGNIPQIGYSHTAFGGLLGWVDNDFETARAFGDLAAHLMRERFTEPTDQSVFHLMYGSSIRHWFDDMAWASLDYQQAYQAGLRSGNQQYAAYTYGHDMYCRFFRGASLRDVRAEAERAVPFARIRLNQWAVDLLEGGMAVCASLTDDASHDAAWEEAFLRRLEACCNDQVICIYRVLRTEALLFLGRDAEALRLSDTNQPNLYMVGTQGLLPWPEHVFTRLLLLAGRGVEGGAREEIASLMEPLRRWGQQCPDNFEHKLLIAEAEVARLQGRFEEAAALYDRAIASARTSGFVQWEGLASERASAFWLGVGNERLAHVYWQQAHDSYSRWGADAKVRLLEEQLRETLRRSAAAAFPMPPALLEARIESERARARHVEGARQGEEALRLVGELAHTGERLRMEVAHRRSAEEALQRHQGVLEARVRARTADLEESHRALSRETDRCRTLMRIAQDGIHLVDDNGNLVEANEAFLRSIGYTRGEAMRLNVVDWDTGFPREQVAATLRSRVQHPGTFETRHRHRDGRTFDVEVSVCGVELDSRQYLLATSRDVSARKESEAQMRGLLAHLEERVRDEVARALMGERAIFQQARFASMGEMLGHIAHHWRQPLNTLSLVVANLCEAWRAGDLTDDFVARAHDRAERLIQNMSRTIGDCNEFLRPNKLSITFSARERVEEALTMVKGMFDDLGVTVDVSGPRDLFTQGNPSEYSQVVLYMLSNAREAVARSGRMDGRVAVVVASVGGRCCVSISDNGGGVDVRPLERIFEPYFTTKENGVGVGLYMSMMILEKSLCGTLSVRNDGEGAAFTMCTPLAM